MTRLLQLNPGIGENIKPGQIIKIDSNSSAKPMATLQRPVIAAPSSSRSSTVVRVAFGQVGSRYVWGASRPGDLLFFRGPSGGGVGHVEIYVGDNRMAHASTPSTGVIVSSLSERYYVCHYIGARRVLKSFDNLLEQSLNSPLM